MNHYENFLAGEYTTIEHITPAIYKELKEHRVTDKQIIDKIGVSIGEFYAYKEKHPEIKGFRLKGTGRPKGTKNNAVAVKKEEPVLTEAVSSLEEIAQPAENYDKIELKLRTRLEAILDELSEANNEIYSLKKQLAELRENSDTSGIPEDHEKLKVYCIELEQEILRYKQFEENVHSNNLVDGMYHKQKIDAYNQVIMGLIKISEIDQ